MPKVEWFARTMFEKKLGPFPSQIAAAEACKDIAGIPKPGSFTWPEYVTEAPPDDAPPTRRKKRRRLPPE